jgi:uncharacterized protein YkwD
MDNKVKINASFFLLLIFLIVTACSATPEPSAAPTLTTLPEPTSMPVAKPETIIINQEAVVEKITVQDVDEQTGEMVVIIEGHTLNSCVSIGDVTIDQEVDIFSIDLQTSADTSEQCTEKSVPFEESVSINTEGMSPGEYLISSGVVNKFEVLATDETAETAVSEEPATTEEVTTEDETSENIPRECNDTALFLSDVTYPDNSTIEAGETFTKTWEIQNTGTCSWGPGYKLEFVSGEFSGVVSLADPFPQVEPSGTVELSVVMTAPLTADTHKGAWVIKRPEGDNVLLEEGDTFDLWVIVIVSSGSGASTGAGVNRVVQDGVVCAESKPNYESDILQLFNEARTDNELPAFELQPQLTNAARKLTTDMACNDFVSQTGSDGSDLYARITAEGYAYADAAEIIFYGIAGLPEVAFNWWMENISVDENILDSAFTQIGIAYAINPQNGGSYYTVVFAAPGG